MILLDWSPLAAAGQFAGTGDYVYDLAARNSMDVGEFTGRCLASLLTQTGLQARDLHMVGHSLGGQLVVSLDTAILVENSLHFYAL